MSTVNELWHTSTLSIRDFNSLISLSTQKSKEFFLAHNNYRLSLFEQGKFYFLRARFKRGVPLAYLRGNQEFFGLHFAVNHHTLIPRPDTEILVSDVLEHLQTLTPHTTTVQLIDIGTGTGCIPISILKNHQTTHPETFAIDISPGALRIARKNAAYHGVKIHFLPGNLLAPLLSKSTLFGTHPIFITANLPYLTPSQFAVEPSIQREPYRALVGGQDGLQLYRELFLQIHNHFSLFSKRTTLWCELDPSQTASFTALCNQFFKTNTLTIKTDLGKHERLAIIQI